MASSLPVAGVISELDEVFMGSATIRVWAKPKRAGPQAAVNGKYIEPIRDQRTMDIPIPDTVPRRVRIFRAFMFSYSDDDKPQPMLTDVTKQAWTKWNSETYHPSQKVRRADFNGIIDQVTQPAIVAAGNSDTEAVKRNVIGTKRQKSDYTDLDYERQWKIYKRNLRVNARMHHCENVLDPAYRPTGADEIAVLKDNNKFMFAVFLSTLNTAHGKTLIRKHERGYR